MAPGSGPHGLLRQEGNIWFTANYKGYMGKMTPSTGVVIEYPLPAPVIDPHSLVFDHQGIIWFTAERGNSVGRLDPQSRELRVEPLSTSDSEPYGIAVNSKGIPFFCEFGTNKLGIINPETMEIKEIVFRKEQGHGGSRLILRIGFTTPILPVAIWASSIRRQVAFRNSPRRVDPNPILTV